MNFDVAVVVDEAELAELVHERIDPGSCGADHLGQGLLTNLRENGCGFALAAEVGQEQKCSRQALFARVEQLVDQILLDPGVARQEMVHEQLGKCWFFANHPKHIGLCDPHDDGLEHDAR